MYKNENKPETVVAENAEISAVETEETTASEPYIKLVKTNKAEEEILSPFVVKFAKPYTFEGKTYDSIDLGGLETMSAKDMTDAESWLTKKGIVSATPEMSMEYAKFIASRVTNLPIEFFDGLHPKNAIKVKNRVTNFFYGED